MKFELQPFHRQVPDDDLLADLVSAYAKLKTAGKTLTFRTYRGVGKYASSTINDRFGGWNNALRRAGLASNKEINVPIEILFDNLRIVWIAKGKQPAYRDMSEPPSQYTGSTYNARFGGWRKALEEFVRVVREDEQLFVNPTPKRKAIGRAKREPSLSLRFTVMKRDNFRCVACGRSPATELGLILEIDHVMAWTNGGNTVPENLQTLCFDCNRGKGAS